MSVRFIVSLALMSTIVSAGDRDYARSAESWRQKPTYISTFSDTVPHFLTGGGWATQIILINFRGSEVTVPIAFLSDGGQPLAVPLLGLGNRAAVDIKVPAGGTVTIATDPAAFNMALKVGFARMDIPCDSTNCGEIGGFAVLTQRVAGRPDFEAVVPIASSMANTYVIAMDNTAGFNTGVAFAAPPLFSFDTANRAVFMTVKSETGAVLLTERFDMKANGHMFFDMKSRYPQLNNRRGTIEFTTTEYVAALGLRFQDGGSFTSTPAFER